MDTKNEFSQVPINREEIPQSLLNIDEKVRSNLFSWNGQFSPQFIEVLLKKYAASNFFVVDPFLGSGTVLCECARQGIKSYGIELNASAFYMAKTYEIANIQESERIAIVSKIDTFFLSIKGKIIDSITAEINNSEDCIYKNLLSTTIILMDIFNNDVTMELLMKKWQLLKDIILKIPFSHEQISAEQGDSRKMNVPKHSADLIITSPPYINVFNYHQKYRRSVEALGFNVLSIAKSEFGSNRKNRGNRFLTVIQYCIDMALSLKEANRICKNNARMIYVVGRESSVLGYSFCNSELIYNLGTEIFQFSLSLRQERVFKNRFGKMIYEDILHFSNTSSCALSEQEIIEKARFIAVRMLKDKLNLHVDNKNKPFLINAIERAPQIRPSEEIV